MEDSEIMKWFFVSLLGFLIMLWIFHALIRSALSIKRQLWNQKTQINLLIELVEKSGSTKLELQDIKEKNNTRADGFLD